MPHYLASHEKPIESKLAYMMALFTVFVWGTTFINTKLLLDAGMTPADITFYRSAIAWIGMFCSCPRPLFAKFGDEMRLLVLGLLGGSLYFVLQNTALLTAQAGNVSFFAASSPVFAILLAMIFQRNIKANWGFWIGSWICCAGIGCLLYNGVIELGLWPWGDVLALGAGLSWACYSLLIRPLFGRYSVDFITRKVLFYTMVTVVPWFAYQPLTTDWQLLTQWDVLPQLLFLGLVAQTMCFTLWNDVARSIGHEHSGYFLYLCPVVTVLGGIMLLGEQWTAISAMGCMLLLTGVYLCHCGVEAKDPKH